MRVLTCALATTHTDPPWPPSPPLGPPRGTNFSRRKARHPRPPFPAATWMSTSSTNIQLASRRSSELVNMHSPFHHFANSPTLFDWLNADHAPMGAVVLELHASGDLRVDRVVFAEACVEARTESAASLADDDRPAGHEVAVVRLDADALRVGIAAVARAALSFFVSHC